MKNPYATLGIKKDANKKEIKSAYRKLAQKYHPDKNPDNDKAEDKFKEIAAAYGILGNEKKRTEYDNFGSGGNPFQQYNGFGINVDFEDMFRDFMGRSARQRTGADIRKGISISFMEAALGAEKNITIEYQKKCESCDGRGGIKPEDFRMCDVCSGTGKMGYNLGGMHYVRTCGPCRGRGRMILNKCSKCAGDGQYKHTEQLKVNIPAGVDNGMSIRLRGKGIVGPTGPGDLYLTLQVMPHSTFTRDRLHIKSTHKVSYIDAILGSKLGISTIHGPITITIPPGTQTDSILSVSEKGIAVANETGNHLAIIKIIVPEQISESERKLLEQIKELG